MTITTDASDTAVSLAEAKDHLRVTHSGQDTLIQALIATAEQYLDGGTDNNGLLGRLLMQRTVRFAIKTRGGPVRSLGLPGRPVSEITALVITDPDGVVHTIDPSTLDLDTVQNPPGATVTPKLGVTLPDAASSSVVAEPIVVTYRVGYPTRALIPQPIRQAMLLHIAHLYLHAEAAQEQRAEVVPMAYDSLIGPYRYYVFSAEA